MQGSGGSPQRAVAPEPPTSHERESERARSSGDPARIRALYHDLGASLRESYDAGGHIDQHGSERVAAWQAAYLARRPGGGCLLDVGCGPRPEVSMRLGGAGRSVVCLDLSWGIASVARDVAAREGAGDLAFVVGDAEALPFAHGVFDVVMADDVIEHVPVPEALLDECSRVLAPTGMATVSTPNRRALSVLVDRLRDLVRGRRRPAEAYFLVPSHLREYSRGELRRLAQPRFGRVRFASTGWDGDGLVKRVATALTSRGPLRGLCRHWVLLGTQPHHSS